MDAFRSAASNGWSFVDIKLYELAGGFAEGGDDDDDEGEDKEMRDAEENEQVRARGTGAPGRYEVGRGHEGRRGGRGGGEEGEGARGADGGRKPAGRGDGGRAVTRRRKKDVVKGDEMIGLAAAGWHLPMTGSSATACIRYGLCKRKVLARQSHCTSFKPWKVLAFNILQAENF